MRLIAVLVPFLSVLTAAINVPTGNPNGVTLGIFAMCGNDPIDCGYGWCCLAGQTCTEPKDGVAPKCYDPALTLNDGKGVIVNAAYFGRIQQHQKSPDGMNGTVTPQYYEGAGSRAVQPASVLMVSSLVGGLAILAHAV